MSKELSNLFKSNEISESQKIKRHAEYAKQGTGWNVARLLIFWPAWAQTLHNADTAIVAADNRIYHLFNIMKKKKCSGVSKIESQITNKASSTINITGQLKELRKILKLLKNFQKSKELMKSFIQVKD